MRTCTSFVGHPSMRRLARKIQTYATNLGHGPVVPRQQERSGCCAGGVLPVCDFILWVSLQLRISDCGLRIADLKRLVTLVAVTFEKSAIRNRQSAIEIIRNPKSIRVCR